MKIDTDNYKMVANLLQTFAFILLLVGVASLGEVVTELTGALEAHGLITNLIGAFMFHSYHGIIVQPT